MNLKDLKAIIPTKFRIGNWVGNYTMDWSIKVYQKFSVLGYIDARDVMDFLDKTVGEENRQRDHKEVAWKVYSWLGLKIWEERVWKWDCWTASKTEKDKWQASDSFKRACVNWGIGRFLYTLPNLYISKSEADSNKYKITEFVKIKFKSNLLDRHINNS